MLSQSQRRVRRFQQALRVYSNCSPYCQSQAQFKSDVDQKHACYQECTKRHVDLEQKLRVTLKFNIE